MRVRQMRGDDEGIIAASCHRLAVRAARHQTCLAHIARNIAWIDQVGDEAIGLRLKLWIDEMFILSRTHGDLAASTVKRKRRTVNAGAKFHH